MGKAKETWTWLLDMEGAGPADSPGLRTLRTLDDILAAHYPGKLGKVLVVNASGMRSSRRLFFFVLVRFRSLSLSSPLFCSPVQAGGINGAVVNHYYCSLKLIHVSYRVMPVFV